MGDGGARYAQDILSRGKVPIVVGGCGFYLNWYLHKKSSPEQITKAPPEIVRKIKKMIDDDQGDWYKRYTLSVYSPLGSRCTTILNFSVP